MEVVAHVMDVGAEICVREHDALGLAGGARGVDERSELAGKNFGGGQAVGGNVCRAGVGNESFVTETLAGDVGASVRDDDLFQLGEAGADGEKLLQLWRAKNEDDLGAAMFQDVDHAVRGFVEVDRNGDGASAVDSEIGGVPLGAIGGKKTNAVAGFHAEFHESGGETGDTAAEYLRADVLPPALPADHLRAGVRQIVDGVQEA